MVETESSLIKKHRKFLLDNKDEFIMIDLGKPIPAFKWFISSKSTWESKTVIYKTESLLNKIAGAHKHFSDVLIRDMLIDASQRMRNISKGSVIFTSGYDYMINKAIELKDVTEVAPNATIRYLKNPYFKLDKSDFGISKEIYRSHLNRAINKSIVEVNYELIEIAMIDYDLDQKKMTKAVLKKVTGLGSTTIKNYLNKYPELKHIYESIKRNSGTEKQLKKQEYNLTQKQVA